MTPGVRAAAISGVMPGVAPGVAPGAALAPRPVVGALLGLGALAAFLVWTGRDRHATLLLVGAGLGLVLYHASFGFTSAWRAFIVERRGAGLRAQMLMLSLAVLLFFPALEAGAILGAPVGGAVAPVGVSLVFGAFLFGIGMQLGGGCGSGTLYTVGGGNLRMVLTLAAFVAGSAIGTAHVHWWFALPAWAPVSFVEQLGAVPAIALHLLAFAAIAAATLVLETRAHSAPPPAASEPRGVLMRALRGPWALAAGAVALALLGFLTLALAGRPWGVTSAFALWGAKIADALGFMPAQWSYWDSAAGHAELAASVLDDVTSVMDFGLVLGALLASGLAGRFAPSWRVSLRSALAALLGGLMLGYGARLSYGCNIGAFFGGIASSSLHGWVWLVAAFLGNVVGTPLRPLFGLSRQ